MKAQACSWLLGSWRSPRRRHPPVGEEWPPRYFVVRGHHGSRRRPRAAAGWPGWRTCCRRPQGGRRHPWRRTTAGGRDAVEPAGWSGLDPRISGAVLGADRRSEARRGQVLVAPSCVTRGPKACEGTLFRRAGRCRPVEVGRQDDLAPGIRRAWDDRMPAALLSGRKPTRGNATPRPALGARPKRPVSPPLERAAARRVAVRGVSQSSTNYPGAGCGVGGESGGRRGWPDPYVGVRRQPRVERSGWRKKLHRPRLQKSAAGVDLIPTEGAAGAVLGELITRLDLGRTEEVRRPRARGRRAYGRDTGGSMNLDGSPG